MATENENYNSSDDAKDKKDNKRKFDFSDVSFPDDFYCSMCKVQMNSKEVYDMHMSGRRHHKKVELSNFVMKGRVNTHQPDVLIVRVPSGHQITTKRTSEQSTIQFAFDDISEPLIGLDFIEEIWLKDQCVEPIYYCALCKASCQRICIVQHVIGYRHRLQYLRLKNERRYRDFCDSLQKQSLLSDLLRAEAMKLEQEFGRGTAKVSVEIVEEEDQANVDDHTIADMDFSDSSDDGSQAAVKEEVQDLRNKINALRNHELTENEIEMKVRGVSPETVRKKFKELTISKKLEVLNQINQLPEFEEKDAAEISVNTAMDRYLKSYLRTLSKEELKKVTQDILRGDLCFINSLVAEEVFMPKLD